MKSEQQAKVKLEAHITAGKQTAHLLNTMFPQFSRATIYKKSTTSRKLAHIPGSLKVGDTRNFLETI